MEEGPSSSSGFSTRATAALQEPPVNLVHSMVLVDVEQSLRILKSVLCERQNWPAAYICFRDAVSWKSYVQGEDIPLLLFAG